MIDVDATWAEYVATRDVGLRNALVEHYQPVVVSVAHRLLPGLPSYIDVEDLIGSGMFGLIDAVTRFEPERGNTFTAFAWVRIRGEIVDQLRRYDVVRRGLRNVERRVTNARTEATRRLQRTPTEAEVADELGVTLEEYARLRATAVVTATPISFDQPVSSDTPLGISPDSFGLRSASVEDALVGDDSDPGDEYDIVELREVVAASWNALPDKERTLLTLRYIEGLTLQETASLLGIASSRVSQVATEAIRLLRSEIAVR